MLEYLDSVDAVKQWLLSFGGWTPFIYFLFQILQVIIAPLPGGTTTLVGGALFGWIKGFLLSEAGIMIGTAAAFGIAKKLGRPVILKWVPSKWTDKDVYKRQPMKSSGAMCVSMMLPLVTAMTKWCCTMSLSLPSPARRSPL